MAPVWCLLYSANMVPSYAFGFVVAGGLIGGITTTSADIGLVHNPTLPSVDIRKNALGDCATDDPNAPRPPLVKRVLYAAGTLISLVITLPFSIVIAALIWLEEPGPIFLIRRWTGKDGASFRRLTFRNTTCEAEHSTDALVSSASQPRALTVGRLLQWWHLDELPGLINALARMLARIVSLVRPETIRGNGHAAPADKRAGAPRRGRWRPLGAAVASAAFTVGVVIVAVRPLTSQSERPAVVVPPPVLPNMPVAAQIFAPYFETWTDDSPSALSQQSGAKYLTMAFLHAATKGSCTVYWNGSTHRPISSATYGADIATIRSNGGGVIASFGGYTAADDGTEIADSCTDVNSIAATYESVISTYNVLRIDLDIEHDSLKNPAGIDRRNKAIKLVEDRAAQQGRPVQFSYTLPATPHGLMDDSLGLLRNAVSNGARIDVINIMTFDYFDDAVHQMAADTQTAATGLHDQLQRIYPRKSSADIWNMIGVTEMIGVDDVGAAETFTTSDAATVVRWAASKGLSLLSFWALQRDNGGCPGQDATGNCSGIGQSTWQFSRAFASFAL
jgi:hypothetical protein